MYASRDLSAFFGGGGTVVTVSSQLGLPLALEELTNVRALSFPSNFREVDEDGCVDAAGKRPHKGSYEVPVTPVNVSMMMTTTAMNKDLTLTTVPAITNEALHCQQLLQAEKDAAYQKTRYDAALGFVNVANIICNQDLLDKMSTAKLTKDALTKAETEYKAALQRVSDLGLCPLVNCSRHSSAKLKASTGKNKHTVQADDFILPTKKQTAKIKSSKCKSCKGYN
ncbi:hypothetical protein CEXT_100351 [Caerostris extrusa]|uniref:BRO1 domain-containing protein n=1 Tax=Caerostris extrusa TaxID=172846 RepID=A0AAV4NBG8_CAEEX|nr:hypothetical protein CEXT_100351 [Caerostris extrusa]